MVHTLVLILGKAQTCRQGDIMTVKTTIMNGIIYTYKMLFNTTNGKSNAITSQ